MALSQGFGGAGVPGTTLKAWVRFNAAGAVLGSFNVASVTKTGAGSYSVNFQAAMASADYVMTCTPGVRSIKVEAFMTGATAAKADIGAFNNALTAIDMGMLVAFYE